MAYEVILGIDFLTKLRMILRCGKRLCFNFEEEKDQVSTIAVLAIQEAEAKLEEILDAKQEIFNGEIDALDIIRIGSK